MYLVDGDTALSLAFYSSFSDLNRVPNATCVKECQDGDEEGPGEEPGYDDELELAQVVVLYVSIPVLVGETFVERDRGLDCFDCNIGH